MQILDELMEVMNPFRYGFPNQDGSNMIETDFLKYDREFDQFYYLQTPLELTLSQCGVCWDQVEFERDFLEKRGVSVGTYFICTYDGDNLPSHTFLVLEEDEKFYWFEHSWGKYQGIHAYSSLKELLLDVKKKFIQSHSASKGAYTFVYRYTKPEAHISCLDFYHHAEAGTLMKLNEPLYFYHLVDRNASFRDGLYSLAYMYRHQLFDLFDQSVEKYRARIALEWHTPYQGRDASSLTRREILDALKSFRGEFGASYIYFFRYPPKRKLGTRMAHILENKVILRINTHDEEVERHIKDIFYGYEGSHRDGKILDEEYYENVTEEEYFSTYDDEAELNFSGLNHIAIAFQDDFCPFRFLEEEK